MYSAAVILAAFSVGVDYGWQEADGGGVEYIIQIEPALISAMQEGEEIISEIPAELGHVRRFRIRIGDQEVPKIDMAELQVRGQSPTVPRFGAPPNSESVRIPTANGGTATIRSSTVRNSSTISPPTLRTATAPNFTVRGSDSSDTVSSRGVAQPSVVVPSRSSTSTGTTTGIQPASGSRYAVPNNTVSPNTRTTSTSAANVASNSARLNDLSAGRTSAALGNNRTQTQSGVPITNSNSGSTYTRNDSLSNPNSTSFGTTRYTDSRYTNGNSSRLNVANAPSSSMTAAAASQNYSNSRYTNSTGTNSQYGQNQNTAGQPYNNSGQGQNGPNYGSQNYDNRNLAPVPNGMVNQQNMPQQTYPNQNMRPPTNSPPVSGYGYAPVMPTAPTTIYVGTTAKDNVEEKSTSSAQLPTAANVATTAPASTSMFNRNSQESSSNSRTFLSFVVLVLFASLFGNVYFGWSYWGIRERYQIISDQRRRAREVV